MENPTPSFSVKYLGGHSAYPYPGDVVLKLGDSQLIVEGLRPTLVVPYASIDSIEIMEQPRAYPVVGLWSLGWKNKRQLMVIRFTDVAGLLRRMVFDSENIGHVQTEVNSKVVASRTSKSN